MSGFVDDADGGEVVCVDEDDFSGPFVPPDKCDDQGGVEVTTDGGDLEMTQQSS